MRCPNCDATVPEQAHFCQECGAPLPVAAATEAPTAARRFSPLPWIALGALVGLLLVGGSVLFLFLPRRPALLDIALSLSPGEGQTARESTPEFYPDGPVYVLIRYQGLRQGDEIIVHWYYEGCSSDQLVDEISWKGSSPPWPFPKTTVFSLEASPQQPLSVGPYRVEIQWHSPQEEQVSSRQTFPFQVVAPPGAISTHIDQATLAWLVGADGLPLEETTVFAPYEVVYLSLQADLGVYSHLEARWSYAGVHLPGVTWTMTTTRNLPEETLTAILASPTPLLGGSYRVDLCLDGTLERSLEFQVQADPSRSGVLFDDFSDPSGLWGEDTTEDLRMTYQDGKYSIQLQKPEWVAWTTMSETFDDVAISVTTEQAGGPARNDYGLICRLMDDDNFYTFDISGDGYYSVWKQENDEWVGLVDWTASRAIRQGNATNRITVLCQGTELSLWANGVLLVRLQDDSFSRGDVGIFAGNRTEGGVHILFDDLLVAPLR